MHTGPGCAGGGPGATPRHAGHPLTHSRPDKHVVQGANASNEKYTVDRSRNPIATTRNQQHPHAAPIHRPSPFTNPTHVHTHTHAHTQTHTPRPAPHPHCTCSTAKRLLSSSTRLSSSRYSVTRVYSAWGRVRVCHKTTLGEPKHRACRIRTVCTHVCKCV